MSLHTYFIPNKCNVSYFVSLYIPLDIYKHITMKLVEGKLCKGNFIEVASY